MLLQPFLSVNLLSKACHGWTLCCYIDQSRRYPQILALLSKPEQQSAQEQSKLLVPHHLPYYELQPAFETVPFSVERANCCRLSSIRFVVYALGLTVGSGLHHHPETGRRTGEYKAWQDNLPKSTCRIYARCNGRNLTFSTVHPGQVTN